ncbi:hypothetical protein [Streptomyces eurythermus]
MNADPAAIADQLIARQEGILGQHENPLLRLARTGRADRRNLRRMVQADLLCMESEIVAYAVLLARFPRGAAGALFAELNSTLRALKPGLEACAQALGALPLVPADPARADGAFCFPLAVSWMGLHAEPAAAALALRADFAAYARDCRELVGALTDAGTGVPEEFRAYYDMSEPARLLTLAAAAVKEGLRRGDDPERAVSVSNLLMSGLHAFWRFAAEAGQPSSAVEAVPHGRRV